MNLLPIHPLVLQYVPEISLSDREKLRDGIRSSNGLIHPIISSQGQVIDGRTRQELCAELGIEARYEEYSGELSIPEYILQCNLRRNVTEAQSDSMILALGREIIPHLREEAQQAKKDGQITGGQVRCLPRNSVGSKRGSETQKRFRKLVGNTSKADAVLSVLNHKDLATAVDKKEMSLKDAHGKARARSRATKQQTKVGNLPRPESIKFPTPEETEFPVNGTMAEKDAHHRKYGRTPLHPKAVKDMLNHSASVSGYVSAILVFTNQTQPDASTFMASIEAMSQWVPQPEKGTDYGINFASKAKKHLALLRERLPVLVQRTNELQAALCEPK